jgi:hypothetical protein
MGDYLMSLIKANDIQNASGGIPTVKGQRLIPTAWVSWNAEGTISIYNDENVSSITDVGVGLFTVNFTTAMADANYAAAMSTQEGWAGHTVQNNRIIGPAQVARTVNSFYVRTSLLASDGARDCLYNDLIVLGGQA